MYPFRKKVRSTTMSLCEQGIRRVLVFCDSGRLQNDLRRRLGPQGVEVYPCRDPFVAEKHAEAINPQLVVICATESRKDVKYLVRQLAPRPMLIVGRKGAKRMDSLEGMPPYISVSAGPSEVAEAILQHVGPPSAS
jgi:hypothetical protein